MALSVLQHLFYSLTNNVVCNFWFWIC